MITDAEIYELENDYYELVEWLHEHYNDLPPNIAEELNSKIYRRYEP